MKKFRVWDKLEKNFIYFTAFEGLLDHCDPTYRKRNLGPIEQFTGLTDSEGKEIYEGDIITEYVKHTREKYDYVVFWCNEQFRFKLRMLVGGNADGWGFDQTMNCKVIGTIHTHSELLEESNE